MEFPASVGAQVEVGVSFASMLVHVGSREGKEALKKLQVACSASSLSKMEGLSFSETCVIDIRRRRRRTLRTGKDGRE